MHAERPLSAMQSSTDREYATEESSADGKSDDAGGRLSGARRRLGRVFSPRAFLVDLVVALVGVGIASSVAGVVPLPFLGQIGGLVGLFLAAFLVGALRSRRQYLEVTLAGAVAMGLVVLGGTLTSVFLPVGVSLLQEYGVAIVGAGAGTGAVVSLLGHYFGRDLRDGLTRNV